MPTDACHSFYECEQRRAVLLVRWLGGASHGAFWHQGPPSRTALDILKDRYARGEIKKDEFEERRRVLGD